MFLLYMIYFISIGFIWSLRPNVCNYFFPHNNIREKVHFRKKWIYLVVDPISPSIMIIQSYTHSWLRKTALILKCYIGINKLYIDNTFLLRKLTRSRPRVNYSWNGVFLFRSTTHVQV